MQVVRLQGRATHLSSSSSSSKVAARLQALLLLLLVAVCLVLGLHLVLQRGQHLAKAAV
jgi:hypothetical protein